jgi:hypothetical protein
MKRGTVLTVLTNTSATPISGTFSNLAEGAIITVNGNDLRVSHHGGNRNDLSLAVVPLKPTALRPTNPWNVGAKESPRRPGAGLNSHSAT